MNGEKRNCARLAMHAKANINLEDQSIEGELENVSMEGAFVTAIKQTELNDVVKFTICDTPINAKAKVVRVTDKGMGLQFEKTLLN